MSSLPRTIGDFSVLPLRVPQLASMPTTTPPATHVLYVRRNAPKIQTPDDDRSLFLANVPVDSTEAHFRALFAALVGPGRFESITFGDERGRRRRHRGPRSSGDDGDSDADSDSMDDALPGQAARLAALQSRKRKRDGLSGAERAKEEAAAAAAAAAAETERQRAALPSTWSRTLHRSGGTAVALLVDEKSVDLVLRAVAKVHKTKAAPGAAAAAAAYFPAWPSTSDLVAAGAPSSARPPSRPATATTVPPLGPAWLAAHNRLVYPDRAAVRDAVDAFFVQYNQQEAEAAARAKRLRNVPDEDGFVTVTRGAGGGGGGGGGGAAAAARQHEAELARAKQVAKQQRQEKEMTHFYRFQLRERKKAEQAELQRKFQEDRKRVAAMREKRGKFKPEV